MQPKFTGSPVAPRAQTNGGLRQKRVTREKDTEIVQARCSVDQSDRRGDRMGCWILGVLQDGADRIG